MAYRNPLGLSAKEIEAFWAMVDRSAGKDACWPWTGPSTEDDGPVMRFGLSRKGKMARGWWDTRRQLSAFFIAHVLTFGPAPKGTRRYHTCDNINCCNPRHIRTQQGKPGLRR